MMRRIAAVLATLLIAGCDLAPYEVSTSPGGQHIILNQWTGNVQRVDDKNLIELGRVSLDEWTKVSLPKVLESQTPSKHNFTVEVTTRFIEDHVAYNVTLSPSITGNKVGSGAQWDKSIVDARGSLGNKITINLVDDFGFHIIQIGLPLTGFTRIVNDNSETALYQAKGAMKLPLGAYQRVDGWELEWNF